MKSIFQSNARSRRHRQTQPTEQETEQAPFFAPAEKQGVHVQQKPQPFFQAKSNTSGVKIGQPNDPYEREADAVADAVVNNQSARKPAGASAPDSVQRLPITPLSSGSLQRLATPDEDKMPGTNDARMAKDKEIQEKPEAGSPMVQKMDAPKEEEKPVQKMDAPKEEEKPVQKMDAPKEEEKPVQKKSDKEEKMQAKEEEEGAMQAKSEARGQAAQPNMGARLAQQKGSGNPLPKSVKSEMEQGIGADFSGVRVHTDSEAVQMNKDVHAQAFTHGQDVYFNSGKYSPESTEGKRLLAHELTHVVQQGGDRSTVQTNLLPNLPIPSISDLIPGMVPFPKLPFGQLIPDFSVGLGMALGRKLTLAEKKQLLPIFGNFLNYHYIRVCERGICSPDGIPRTIGNIIAVPKGFGTSTLIHEAAHVWQHQNNLPFGYIPSALLAQGMAAIIWGSRNKAYDYSSMVKYRIPWKYWNAEQQAEWIETNRRLPNYLVWGLGGHLPVF